MRRGQWRRVAVWLGFAVIVAAGVGSMVSAPYYVERSLEPIDARSLIRDVTVDGEPVAKPSTEGALMIPVIDSHRARWTEVVVHSILGTARVERQQDVGDPAAEHGHVAPRDLLKDAQQIATLLAADEHDIDTIVTGVGVRVLAVGEAGSRARLRSGDVVVRLNETRIRTYGELQLALEKLEDGEPLRVQLADRGVVELGAFRSSMRDTGRGWPARVLGVAAVETAEPEVVEPRVEWRVPENTGGVSAGLPFALAVSERIAGTSVTGDRRVYATGEIGSDGGVYGVGGVRTKAKGAADDGADLFLVPQRDGDTARRNADDVAVSEVDSFSAALEALAD